MSSSWHGLNAFLLAIGLWVVVVAIHVWRLPAGSLAKLYDLRGDRLVICSSGCFLSFVYWIRAFQMACWHQPMGDSWWAKVCRGASVTDRLVMSEIFLIVALAVMQRSPIAGFVLFVMMIGCAAVLAPTIPVTMWKAEQRRRSDEQRKLRENLAFLEEAR